MGFSLISSVNIDRIDIVSSELIKVMISRRKEGRKEGDLSALAIYVGKSTGGLAYPKVR